MLISRISSLAGVIISRVITFAFVCISFVTQESVWRPISHYYLKFVNTNEIPKTLLVPIVNLEDFKEQECYKQIENLSNFKQTKNEDLSSKISNNVLRTDNSLIKSCKFYNVTDEDRVESI